MTEITHPSPTEYCFQYLELSCKKCMPVKEILEFSEEGDFVLLKAKIANISDTSTVGPRSLKMAEAPLLDTKGEIKISLFEQNIPSVKMGSVYNITNSRVRCWNGVKKLTTPSSIISQTEDEKLTEITIENTLLEHDEDSTVVVPCIKSVERVELYPVCVHCSRKLLQATASLIVKCDRCGHSMVLSNCQNRRSVHFTVESPHMSNTPHPCPTDK